MKGNKVANIVQKAAAELAVPADATFKPEKIESSYMVAENVSGDVYFDGSRRTLVVSGFGPAEFEPGQAAHTLLASTISIKQNGEDEGAITLPANRTFVLPAKYTEAVEMTVTTGAVEIIDAEKTSTRQKVVNGMQIDYDTTLTPENGGNATIRLADGSYVKLNADEDLTLKLLESPDTPNVQLQMPNGFYYAKISSFDAIGRRSTASGITMMAPSICADRQPPMPNAGPAERNVSIFKKLVIDGEESFDSNGEILGYWMDTDLTRDNNEDGDETNDQDLGNDLDVHNDFDGDGREDNDFDDKIFTLGPYADLTQRKVKLNVIDEAGNISGQEVTINIYVPSLTVKDSTAEEGVIRGVIDPVDDGIPVSILRERGGVVSKIKTNSADHNGKYFTNTDGEIAIADLNLKDTIVIKNDKGEVIGEIDPKTGRVILYNSDYSIEVLSAMLPLLPTRVVVKDKDGNVITTIFLVPDMNTDTVIDAPDFPYDEATTAVMTGVHVKDLDALDEFEFRKIPADDPLYPGSTEIIEQATKKRAAILDTGGNFYPLDSRLSLKLREAATIDDPLVIQIIFTLESGALRELGEFFIAVTSKKGLQIVSADKFRVFIEGSKTKGPLFDGDNDGIPDQWELVYGLNPNVKSDGALDSDGDGLTNLEEYQAGTNPLNPDSDSDGYNDAQEVIYGQDPTKKAVSPYTDVTADNPYYQSILNLAQRNILKGIPSGNQLSFGPDEAITRAEFAKIMLDIFCIIPRKEAYGPPPAFTDILFSTDGLPWYYAVTKEAYFQGLITGYLGEIDKLTGKSPFKPDNIISRAEAVKVILEGLELKGAIQPGKIPSATPWYLPYMQIGQDLSPYLKQKEYLKNAYIITAEEAKDPNKAITRAEFIAMADRVLTAYDCSAIDDDKDGMPSYYERLNGLNPLFAGDASLDPDGDSLTNLEEYKHGTDPHDPDTDGGGVTDGNEIKKGTNPRNKPADDPTDIDGDGLTDRDEKNVFGTDPTDPDTDGGGVTDGNEVLINNTNPLNKFDDKDTDGDRLSDSEEVDIYKSDPYKPDTDGGGIKDGDEVDRGTDPNRPDDDLIDPRSDLEEGIYLIQEECRQCPCPSAIDHTADIIPGDKVFGIISSNDDKQIFSRSNIVEITLIPKP